MKAKRNFFKTHKHNDDENEIVRSQNKVDENGFSRICIFSRLFSLMNKTIIGSNAMYHELRNDIRSSIETIPKKNKILVDVVETEESTEFAREAGEIGFSRYMKGLCYGQRKDIIHRTIVFCFFALIGVGIEILLYLFLYEKNIIPFWLFKSLEVFATLFLWTCGGYFTFEFPGEIRSYKRNKQIRDAKFSFRHFD